MAPDARKILEDALRLPPEQRAEVAGQLLRSLDDEDDVSEAEVEAAWGDEIARRMKELDDGTVKPLSWQEAQQFIDSDDESDR